MPRIRCLCNEVINLSTIPNRQEFNLIWEPRVEKLIDSLTDAHRQAASDEEFEKQAYNLFYLTKPKFPEFCECPHCGRLIVFARSSNAKPAFWYQREQVSGEADSLRSLCEGTGDS